MTDRTRNDMVRALERRRINAMLAADLDALDELLHANLLFGHTDGHADDKEAYLAKFRSGAVRYFDAEQRITDVRIIGEAALVRFYLKLRAVLAAGERRLSVVALTIWVPQDGRWRMIAHQPTVTSL